ncbi:MAG: RdgB/HAM1 family non-canonical purine NTP pyrophosphatase [Anaerolineales bacterium]|nr:RdgB/HAM1 family non-canonical purine NTP pyrophosphatase [Anaerolineales bacterium]
MLTKLKGAILLATNNAGKLIELQQLLSELEGLNLLTPKDVGINLDVEEVGHTYMENARLKGEAYRDVCGLTTLADDSGLEVDALGGEPGIWSARYSNQPGASDADRRAFLLAKLAGKPRPWTARFVAWVVVAEPGEDVLFWEGECWGEIIPEERGENGFGYDPIFFFPDLGKTMAELSDEEKNRISHRGNAVRGALPALKDIYQK